MALLEKIYKDSEKNKKSLALLLDPDEYNQEFIKSLFSENHDHVSYIFLGGSLITKDNFEKLIRQIRDICDKPLIIFPGNSDHVSSNADAILFLSLISGRNPEYLIGQQVISAPKIKRSGLEVLPTAYMLIDGGAPTTVQYMSNTFPLPADKPDIAASTALAGKYMGFKLNYLDAGSGARNSISPEIIHAVKKETNMPLIVGGGISNYKGMEKAFDAGADIVVIGNALQEKDMKIAHLQPDQS